MTTHVPPEPAGEVAQVIDRAHVFELHFGFDPQESWFPGFSERGFWIVDRDGRHALITVPAMTMWFRYYRWMCVDGLEFTFTSRWLRHGLTDPETGQKYFGRNEEWAGRDTLRHKYERKRINNDNQACLITRCGSEVLIAAHSSATKESAWGVVETSRSVPLSDLNVLRVAYHAALYDHYVRHLVGPPPKRPTKSP